MTPYDAMVAKLSTEDFRSQTWRRIADIFEERLNELRKQNDAHLDQVKTSEIRGRISELKKILALPTGSAGQGADRMFDLSSDE